MQAVRFVSFCLNSTATRSAVHILASAGELTAPYPVRCKMQLFGGVAGPGVPAQVDGLRLTEPDGMRVEDVFPVVKEQVSGLFGIELELTSQQPRINLGPSQCLLECRSGDFAVRYAAEGSVEPVSSIQTQIVVTPQLKAAQKRLADRKGEPFRGEDEVPSTEQVLVPRRLVGWAGRDAFWNSSLVLVNANHAEQRPAVRLETLDSQGRLLQRFLPAAPIPARSVIEIALNEELVAVTEQTEFSWGLARHVRVVAEGDSSMRGAILMRDTRTQAPTAVVNLQIDRSTMAVARGITEATA